LARAIAADATIEDIADGLADPVEYVRSALARMIECKQPDVVLTIGVTGIGPYPRYRLSVQPPSGTEKVIATYNDNGTLLPTSPENKDSWSSKSSRLDDVKQLLGRVRDRKKGRI
jgi:hypothetical protein